MSQERDIEEVGFKRILGPHFPVRGEGLMEALEVGVEVIKFAVGIISLQVEDYLSMDQK